MPLDLKRNIYRQFESVEENLIKYVNARFIHYKREKFGTSFIFLQGKCKYFKGLPGWIKSAKRQNIERINLHGEDDGMTAE